MSRIKFHKWATILLNIELGNLSIISKVTDVTYSHADNVVKELVEKGLIVKIRKQGGRENKFVLTIKGREVSDALARCYSALGFSRVVGDKT